MRVPRRFGSRPRRPTERELKGRFRACVLLALTCVLLSAPLEARADTQVMSITVGPSLGITLGGPVTLTPLILPGQTSSGSSSIVVVALGGWALKLKDGAASNAGHLQRTVGSTGTPVLNHALDWTTSGSGVTAGSGSLSGTDATGATGTLTRTVNINYSQQVDSDELLALGSVYSLTVTWTLT